MRAYPAILMPDPDGGFTVTFRDVPEAITEGDSLEEALLCAEDALESALAMYVIAKEPLPAPSAAQPGETVVPLSALGMAKAALYEAMREQSVGRAELARRLRWHDGCAGTCRRSPACSTCAMPRRWSRSKPPSPRSA